MCGETGAVLACVRNPERIRACGSFDLLNGLCLTSGMAQKLNEKTMSSPLKDLSWTAAASAASPETSCEAAGALESLPSE